MRYVTPLGLMLVLSGCGSSPPAAEAPAPPSAPASLSRTPAEVFLAHGVGVALAGSVTQPWSAVPGRLLTLTGGALAAPAELQLFVFPSPEDAAASAGRVPAGPRVYSQEALVAVYEGGDPAVLALLDELMRP